VFLDSTVHHLTLPDNIMIRSWVKTLVTVWRPQQLTRTMLHATKQSLATVQTDSFPLLAGSLE